MMRNIVLAGILGFLSLSMEAKVVVYPKITDKAVIENEDYRVYVKEKSNDTWKEVQVLQVDVDMDTWQKAAMAQFDMDSSVEIKVYNRKLKAKEVRIRPLSRKIKFQAEDEHTIVFTVERPTKLSIEFEGNIFNNLHLFANPIETERYEGVESDEVIVWNGGGHDIFRKRCRLIYFGPGVHQPKDLPNNEISIPSNCTVYLAPGALLKAKLRLDKVKNVRIIGRGILFQPMRGVEITHSRNVLVEGITVLNPMHYTIFGGESENVTIRNIKSFSVRGWSDGIDLMCCRNWLIDDVFLRTSDDCLAFYNHRWWYWGDSRNLTVQHSVLWADVAHTMHVGLHGDDLSRHGETISKVKFQDIDVLNVDEDDDNYRGVMAICSGDKNKIKDILFEDIRVEDCEEARLIDIRVNYNEKYNRVPGGRIENITFRNISYQGGKGTMFPSRIKGYDENSDIRNIKMENIRWNGNLLKDIRNFETNSFVSGVEVKER